MWGWGTMGLVTLEGRWPEMMKSEIAWEKMACGLPAEPRLRGRYEEASES